MVQIPFVIADAFCIPEKNFSGNPAAVCLLDSDNELSDDSKANIAAEINLSQTAFVSKSWYKTDIQPKERHFTIRWFSPTSEVALCGHATLASSRVLFNKMERGNEAESTIYFETKYKGNLSATMNWNNGRIRMNFPLTPVTPITEIEMPKLSQFLQQGMQPFDTNLIHSVHYASSTKYLFVRLNDANGDKVLTDLTPDFQQLSGIEGNNLVLGLIMTVKGSSDVHFYSRFFAPWLGVNEDAVCGSAHCALVSYWSKELNLKNLLGRQSSKRSGYVYCSINTSTPDRVELEGCTNVFAHGELQL